MKFEYKIIDIGTNTPATVPVATFIATVQVLLNAQGEEGWQLITVDTGGLAYMMRAIHV